MDNQRRYARSILLVVSSITLLLLADASHASESREGSKRYPVKPPAEKSSGGGAREGFVDAAKELPIVGHLVNGYEGVANAVSEGIASFTSDGNAEEQEKRSDEAEKNMEIEYGDSLVESVKKKYPRVAAAWETGKSLFGLQDDPVQFVLDEADEKVKHATGIDEFEDHYGVSAPPVLGSERVVKAVKETAARYGERAAEVVDSAKQEWTDLTSGSDDPASVPIASDVPSRSDGQDGVHPAPVEARALESNSPNDYWASAKQNLLEEEAAAGTRTIQGAVEDEGSEKSIAAAGSTSQQRSGSGAASSGAAEVGGAARVGVIDIDTYHSPTIEEQSERMKKQILDAQRAIGAVEVGVLEIADEPATPEYAPSPQDRFAERLEEFAMAESAHSRQINAVRSEREAAQRSESAAALDSMMNQFQQVGAQMQQEARERAQSRAMERQQQALQMQLSMTQQPVATASQSAASGCHPGHDEVAHPGGCHAYQ